MCRVGGIDTIESIAVVARGNVPVLDDGARGVGGTTAIDIGNNGSIVVVSLGREGEIDGTVLPTLYHWRWIFLRPPLHGVCFVMLPTHVHSQVRSHVRSRCPFRRCP